MIRTEPIMYSARDVQAITGVPMTSQRNWRVRGFLPPLEDGKHFRADVFDMALLKVTANLAERLPVADAVEVAGASARTVAYHALACAAAWRDLPAGENVETAARQALVSRYGRAARAMPADYLIIWTDGTETWASDVNAALEAASFQQTAGAILMLDLAQIGFDLGSAGYPLHQALPAEE